MKTTNQNQLENIIDERTAELRQTHEETLKLLHFLQAEIEKRKQSEKALHKALEALQESESKLRTMLNFSPDGVLHIDFNGIIGEVSDIAIDILGANKKDDIINQHLSTFIPEQAQTIIQEILDITIAEGLSQDNELNITKLNGEQTLIEFNTALIQDSNGNPNSIIVAFRDISTRSKQQINQIHADRMANLGQMASGMSHEINQPLNIISMIMDKMLYDVEKGVEPDKQYLQERIDKVFENLIRIRNIIDHIQVFSRNQINYIPTAFNINKGIENSLSFTREQLRNLAIELRCSLTDDLPDWKGNIYQFEHAILNLINNAKDAVIERKRIENSEYVPNIHIKTYMHQKTIYVKIKDNGIGIDSDKIDEIMLPFFSTKEEGKGTGMGLAICYQIIKEMKGVISVESQKFSHTTFTIIFKK